MKKKWQTVVIVGAQWGDEGKGKVTDYYGSQTDYVVRFQGGNNAGHTIVYKNSVHKLHLLPSGVLHPRNKIVISNGVVIDPKVLLQEIKQLEKINIKPKLLISERAHVIFPFHVLMDEVSEGEAIKKNLSALSTKRGIWPTYSNKAARVGMRMVDMINPQVFKKKFDLLFDLQQKKLLTLYNHKLKLDKQKIFKEYQGYARILKKNVVDVSLELNLALARGKRILFEGAQGAMLDVDHGVYPFTTSSNTIAGAVCAGSGVGPHKIDKIIGVVKAYLSRVGGGPLPSELNNEIGDEIREIGKEYGTTTGRPRRIGWLDLVQLRLATRINGFDSLAMTKIDILNGFKEVKICTGYKVGHKVLKEMPADLTVYENCQPILKIFKGWNVIEPVTKNYKQLPMNMRKYFEFIEKDLGVPIEMVSVGPERNETILK